VFFVREGREPGYVEVDVHLDKLPRHPSKLAEARFVVEGNLQDGARLARETIRWWLEDAPRFDERIQGGYVPEIDAVEEPDIQPPVLVPLAEATAAARNGEAHADAVLTPLHDGDPAKG